MANFDPEFLKAVAHGDKEATELANKLSSVEKINLGIVVEEMRKKENIVPMSNGFSIYEQKKVSEEEHDALGKALAERNRQIRENEERQEKIRQEFIEKEVKAKTERARAGLAMNDRR